MIRGFLLFIVLSLGLSGCGAIQKPLFPFGEFEELGQSPTQLDFPPVIIIPGIKGSKLVRPDDPKTVLWGTSFGNTILHRFDDLALYPRPLIETWDDQHYLDTTDPIRRGRPTEVLEEFIVGLPGIAVYRFSVYKELVRVLERDPARLPRGKMFFLYAYDWRADNRLSAVRLAKALPRYENSYLEFQAGLALGRRASQNDLLEKCVQGVKRPSTDTPRACQTRWDRLRKTGALDSEGNVRFTLVAHSMGGLVSRYFIEGLGYKGRVNKLILFGTPNLGAMGSLRAIAEGEKPESLSAYLGLGFDKEETRKIYLSFSSIFQLLPRYPGALTDAEGRDLAERFGLGKKSATPEVIKEWRRYFLPVSGQLQGYFPHLDAYLQFQLESARCFHEAIVHRAQRCPDEDTRILQITRYVEKAETTPAEMPPKGPPRDPPTVILGGNCYETLTEAQIDQDKVLFQGLTTLPTGSSVRTGAYLYGDGRVPIKSLDFPRDEKAGDATFLLCRDHTDIVKDKTLQYNLLRAIFKPSPKI
jgi:pimeloyl-ACP methyl ester carboxylesterase